MSAEVYEDIDVCEELISSMRRLEFSEDSIEFVMNSDKYQQASTSHKFVQRTTISMLLYNILINSKTGETVPFRIRSALNYSPELLGWLSDIKLVVLPFLKANEENFF